ncbi:MAG: helix-turn-helix transcriptional regulator, partial [Saprospiraceae bacterium]|nr:helix-turn-helix transcriptional regulator [Saprospiraceae bacterium]
MNAQPNIQSLLSRRSALHTVIEQDGQFGAPTPHEPYVSGETAGSILGVERQMAAGPHIHFVARIRELIEAHIDDEAYGIDQLCRDAGASRSQIHNKLKKWTGLSTTFFIRSIKLHRAKYLLVHTDLNISQVTYEVGFRDPSYF